MKIRVTTDEYSIIRINAMNTGKSTSSFIRDLALGSKEVKQAATQQLAMRTGNNQIAFELRKIGAMMRGFYPKEDLSWTNEDKRRYWEAMETLLQRAYVIEKSKR
ncbi:MAG: hypothetical protein HOP20_09120 [Sulfuriferula sp.]|nr:hypothetical protein [Sulfuriferula sp.]NOT18206.1 hypothetical protein [Sulfuriferula sp.]